MLLAQAGFRRFILASLCYVLSFPPLEARKASFLSPPPLYSCDALLYHNGAAPYSLSDPCVLADSHPTFVAFSLSIIVCLTIKLYSAPTVLTALTLSRPRRAIRQQLTRVVGRDRPVSPRLWDSRHTGDGRAIVKRRLTLDLVWEVRLGHNPYSRGEQRGSKGEHGRADARNGL